MNFKNKKYFALLFLIGFLFSCENDNDSKQIDEQLDIESFVADIVLIKGKKYSMPEVMQDTELANLYMNAMGSLSDIDENGVVTLEIFTDIEKSLKSPEDFIKRFFTADQKDRDDNHLVGGMLFEHNDYHGRWWAFRKVHLNQPDGTRINYRFNLPASMNDKTSSMFVTAINPDGRNSNSNFGFYLDSNQRRLNSEIMLRGDTWGSQVNYYGGDGNDAVSSINIGVENDWN